MELCWGLTAHPQGSWEFAMAQGTSMARKAPRRKYGAASGNGNTPEGDNDQSTQSRRLYQRTRGNFWN